MNRSYNFSAGPATLPEAVLQQARDEILNWRGSGMSVMEMSHRGKDFLSIAERSEASLRQLLQIPDNYKVLFLQGGATTQFSMVPMNLLPSGASADYVDSGIWAGKAVNEARRIGANVRLAATGEAHHYLQVPEPSVWDCDPDAAYLHYTANETIAGVEFRETPDSGVVPLVCDMSSNILSRPIDVSRYGLIYAGAQKNIGPAGLTLVIIREDLIGKAADTVPSMMDYAIHAKSDSMFNTPPTYAWYLAGLVFDWLLEQGGLSAMQQRNQHKAHKLYQFIDASAYYRNGVSPESRSMMNVTFSLADESQNGEFLAQAADQQLLNLKGHRALGGMRASIYNAMPEAGVDALIDYMKEFERTNT
ncbi:MAG: 3-phosphoserine/phosphohydroxythreonine aminotransferase [Proteobacteria bacterium]|nr:MAG: 3-phosphoserine/phosphohydroxythreonine aminotransferase [Pseudomonadota bacterium]